MIFANKFTRPFLSTFLYCILTRAWAYSGGFDLVIRAFVAELHENGFHQALDGVLGGAVGRLKIF